MFQTVGKLFCINGLDFLSFFDCGIKVLYDGRIYDTQNPTRYLRDKLLVFDWDGKPVKYYKLSKPIFHFDIDEKHGILYGLSDNPEFHIISFSLF